MIFRAGNFLHEPISIIYDLLIYRTSVFFFSLNYT